MNGKLPFSIVQTIEKKKNQPDVSHGVPLPKSTFVKENEKGVESIPIKQQNMEPIQQSKSFSPIPTPSLLNSVNFRGRVVSFNEECKLRAIPLPLQREVYKQTVLFSFHYKLAKREWNGHDFCDYQSVWNQPEIRLFSVVLSF